MKRLLDCHASDFENMTKDELVQSIVASEGRTLLSENIVTGSAAEGLTNSEVAKAAGADLILLNALDLFDIYISGLDETDDPIRRVKQLVGRPVGVNLEPIDLSADFNEQRLVISEGRMASKKTFQKANDLGFDFICLTGNPKTGVSNDVLVEAVKQAKEQFNGMIIAGKMHQSGVAEPVMTETVAKRIMDAGADVLLMPAVATVPGVNEEMCRSIVELAKKEKVLTMASIGTSQESADPSTIRQIGLMNKVIGFDIHHIGDSGYSGISPYENIIEMSKVIRGNRHTIRRMADSVNR
ncbi:DUF7916 family protein [Alkalibacterium sp. MB6]|uniref:DUF7916 family protein n=1 Tax=Alkalibacterium sp. MB6 TaxID=2081965 RepID=UPI00137B0FD3|nr:haloacid dehalogenase-like hydrolase [Alkalibacterium sp. MB6]